MGEKSPCSGYYQWGSFGFSPEGPGARWGALGSARCRFCGHGPASFLCGVAHARGGRFARPVGQRAGRSRRLFHCDSQRGEFAAPWPRFSTSHDALRFVCSY